MTAARAYLLSCVFLYACIVFYDYSYLPANAAATATACTVVYSCTYTNSTAIRKDLGKAILLYSLISTPLDFLRTSCPEVLGDGSCNFCK